jgi:hypothetical protein
VDVIISDPAKEYVRERGGTVYVSAHAHTCCSGSMTLLDVKTTPPKDASNFVSAEAPDIDVMFRDGNGGRPQKLAIEMRGMLRPHLVAYWDGCAFKP